MNRPDYLHRINMAFKVNPIVALLGPRQCGKTTLAKQYVGSFNESPFQNYFDLEDPDDLIRLESPKLTLSNLENLITLDEIQRLPEIFPLLRVLVDNSKLNQQYLILGSASRELIKQSSETLAGRISYIEVSPFSWGEVDNLNKLWIEGGFPKAYLNESDISFTWRKDYIRTYLEKDIPMLGIDVSPENLRRFWMMLVHYHGNIFNASEIGRSLNISHPTAKNYLDILTHTFMIRELKPWYENIGKRQVKSSKVYFRDSGIMHALMGIRSKEELMVHPKLGASWEGFAMEAIIRKLKVEGSDCYFWATHGDAELDLLVIQDNKRLGFEFKFTDLPRMSKSMHIALDDLKLDSLTVIHPGIKNYKPQDNVIMCGLEEYLLS